MKSWRCKYCNKKFERYPGQVRNPERVYCSMRCKGLHQKSLLIGTNNPNYRGGKWINDSRCKCGNLKDCRAKQCGRCAKKSLPKDIKSRISDRVIITKIRNSKSILEVANKLGIDRQRIAALIRNRNINIRHLRRCNNRPYECDILVKKSNKPHAVIKALLLRNKLRKYRCKICNLGPMWYNKKLTLQLDHINGDNTDNRLQNLRFLCPNCHTQQPTSFGGNIKLRKERSGD